ncbi:hypothetical protein KSD_88360 [Ktedonobacter sp. SOSP1-85]|nr:hypothetical protein KSD_88360 [Ktedonobacter sp. SOSP1-85]
MVAPKLFATDTFFIFLMIQFIRGIPTELDDTARIDGCSHFSFYWRIILPLALPALVTTAIFTFIWTWNDFFSQLIYLSDEATFTIPVALSDFSAWSKDQRLLASTFSPCELHRYEA